MGTVQRWTGQEARALRLALRMSVRRFASHLGVSDRTVSNWEARGEKIALLPDSQALLDTALERSDPDVRQRFWESTGTRAVTPASVTAADTYLPIPLPEPGLVHRPEDYESLLTVLNEAADADGVASVALCGPGGFGKTTLATQICQDSRVRELFPEILWVETGEGCTPARVVELISDLCVHLGGGRPALTDPDQAGFHLARLLHGRRALLVIDNVWSAADLAPFLLGGEGCVRLITTRNVRVCPSAARVVRLGPMAPGEIRELLTRNVAALPHTEASRLAQICGGWPLLATVIGSAIEQDVAAGAPAHRVAREASETIQTHGPQAFDVWDADQRKNAIGQAISSSLRSLEDSVRVNGGTGLRNRYLSLAVFPPSEPIPVQVLTHWWGTAHGWTPHAVRQFCRILADRSLISTYLADHGAIVLHDVFRSFLRHLIAEDWPDLHRSLLESYRRTPDGRWASLDATHTYMWRQLPHHLHEAGLDSELIGLLASPAYMVRKVSVVGHQALAADAAVLDSLPRQHEDTHPEHQVWSTARLMAGAGYLLSGLDNPADIASTLSVALRRSSYPAAARSLDNLTAAGPALRVTWLRGEDDFSAEPPADGHVGAVVAVSSAHRLAASGGEDGVVRLWDIDERQLLRDFHAHTGWVYATALSPDGSVVASAGDDAVIRLWRTDTGTPVGVLAGHSRRIRTLAFSPTGGVLVSGAEDGAVCAWDTDRLTLLRKMQTAGTPVWSVAIGGEDGSAVAAVGEDEFLRLFDLGTGRLLDEQAGHRDWVRSVAFASETTLLATGSGDRSVVVWNTANQRLSPLRRTTGLGGRVRAVALDKHGDVVVAATEEPRIQTFTAGGPSGEVRPPAGVDWVRSVARTDDGSLIAGCEDGAVRLWPAGTGHLETLAPGSNTVWSTAFGAAGSVAAIGDGAGNVTLLDAATSALRRKLSAGQGRVWSLAAGDEYVAAACGDGTVRAWSLDPARAMELTLNRDVSRTWAVAVASSAPRLAASTGDGQIRCWDLPDGSLLWSQDLHAGRLRSIAFDDRGDLLAACGGDGSVRVWRAVDGEFVTRFSNPGGWARTVTVDGPGTRTAVGAGTGDISVRDLRSDRFTAHLSGHTGRILMLGFAGDEDRLVSAAADGTVRLWSLSEQRQITQVRVDASLHCAAFDRATHQVLVGSAAGVVTLAITNG
ncbi:NB-ARC domain-containing protein [Streptomyces aidingensis]|uniref:WD40 repeat n=1 Tax=Streptomyces aidingensis TaxID=910347 RepID=A0A1I1KL53_9ACTN|nr:NB-ARC domain-containing protein [Streptomyces aidingensis]SFC61527.1 WD40 repeat [Streptomyces aidingensis]